MPLGYWDIRVLYVTSGKGYPYAPLDQAIEESLRPLVRELIVGNPNGDPIHIGNAPISLDMLIDIYKPDLMLVLEGMNLPPETVDRVRNKGVRTALWLTDDPYYIDFTSNMVPHYDDVFTLELNCVPFYRQLGCPRVHYLPLASLPRVFRPKTVSHGRYKEISFIGSGYWNRVAAIDRIAPYLAGKNVRIAGIWWERLRQFKLLESHIELGTWLDPETTADAYNSSKIVINMHRAHDDEVYNQNSLNIPAASPNPRTFEIGGCGTLQLTDERHDLQSFYTPGSEIVTYADPDDLVAKLDYYLLHEEERMQIALNGLYRTVRDHTYPTRLSQLLTAVYS
jgi:spore maturation protein CgeB